MKYTFRLLSILILLVCFSCQVRNIRNNRTPILSKVEKGKTVNSVNVNGVSRDYILYVPKNYSASKSYPLLFSFHGFTSTMEKNYDYTKFNELAEQENFIVVHPQGLKKRWNAITKKSINKDIKMITSLINQLKNIYSIDEKRIYATGMSNGGYLSFLLACESSNKFAAVASVTGLMFPNVLKNCHPSKPVPVLQIHGTSDNIVKYQKVDEVLQFWITNNATDSQPIIANITDVNSEDNSTVTKYVYKNGKNNTEVHHFKVSGGSHDWPGAWGNMDIQASQEVWNFLKNYDINGRIN